MIFAAGLGTRLQAETHDKPKALVQIGNKTLLELAIEKLIKTGVSEIAINVHHFSTKIKAFLSHKDFGIPIQISDERGELLDTGGGLKKASPFLSDTKTIIIYNVYILSNLNLSEVVNSHLNSGALATLVVRERETQLYLKFDEQKKLVGWVNKKSGENKISNPANFSSATEMAFSGIQIIQPEIFQFFPKQQKFSIIDFYLELAKTQNIQGYFDESELWMDVGKPIELEEARQKFAL